MREGVAPSQVQLPAGAWPTVLDFLAEHFRDIGAQAWRSRMERGLVTLADGAAVGPATPYVPGASVLYFRELAQETPVPFQAEVLHQDEHLLVADKPHFLPVIPAGRHLQETLLVRLKKQTGLADLVPLHRIDRGTAGLVVFSTSAETRGRYQQLFPRREVEKTYEALAPNLSQLEFPLTRRSRLIEGEPFFRMREADGEPNSETLIERLEIRGALSLYRLSPVTGRKHQLRVHMAMLGAPIVNDDFYPQIADVADDDFSRPLKLLARSIAFSDPLSGELRRFTSRREL
jgi:tRNA pseudouridine32 synthase/23S rRNA pseudouridine746 synthase